MAKGQKKNAEGQTVERTYDTRAPNVIFQDRAGKRLSLLDYSFDQLARIGNARKAKPSVSQVEFVRNWLNKRVQETMGELERSLRQEESVQPAKRQVEIPA